jgi:hypothetical protein
MNILFNEFTRLSSVMVIFTFNLLIFTNVAHWQLKLEDKIKIYRYFTYSQLCLILLVMFIDTISRGGDNLFWLVSSYGLIIVASLTVFLKIINEKKDKK